MTTFKPFCGIRPPREFVERVSCLPYDVLTPEEVRLQAADNPLSLLHITRAEVNLENRAAFSEECSSEYSLNQFRQFLKQGWLKKDAVPSYYVYALTIEGRTQVGVVGLASCEEYRAGTIKCHELTRPDKEDERMKLIDSLSASIEPVFLCYRAVPAIDELVARIMREKRAAYQFFSKEKVVHCLWKVDESQLTAKLEKLFAEKVPVAYVADGHHRAAAAARVGQKRRDASGGSDESEGSNFFMAALFPDNQLKIWDYNRVIKDLNGYKAEKFIERISSSFEVIKLGKTAQRPSRVHEMTMYLEGDWYLLRARQNAYDDSDAAGSLDVTILTACILEPILGIDDLRRSDRIDFVGGIYGPEALRRQVDSGNMKLAFALFPVTIEQLIAITDQGKMMPPKTTWFEPKLYSGLVIYSFADR